jgi:hypothetical protein
MLTTTTRWFNDGTMIYTECDPEDWNFFIRVRRRDEVVAEVDCSDEQQFTAQLERLTNAVVNDEDISE